MSIFLLLEVVLGRSFLLSELMRTEVLAISLNAGFTFVAWMLLPDLLVPGTFFEFNIVLMSVLFGPVYRIIFCLKYFCNDAAKHFGEQVYLALKNKSFAHFTALLTNLSIQLDVVL